MRDAATPIGASSITIKDPCLGLLLIIVEVREWSTILLNVNNLRQYYDENEGKYNAMR